MNSFYKIVEHIKGRLDNNKNVGTTIFSSQDHSDLNKKNIYPIVYINPISAPVNGIGLSSFSFEVAAMDQRDESNEFLTDKFTGNDNLIDNLNITHSILNDLYTYLEMDPNDSDIILDNASAMTPIYSQQANLLDGWLFNITLKIKNDGCL